jgi:hypothetical protein
MIFNVAGAVRIQKLKKRKLEDPWKSRIWRRWINGLSAMKK